MTKKSKPVNTLTILVEKTMRPVRLGRLIEVKPCASCLERVNYYLKWGFFI
jgi:hypothetical protein